MRKSKKTPEQRRDDWIRSQLRRITIKWPAANEAKKAARVDRRINPKSGREAWHSKCAICQGLFPESQTELDHIESVIPFDQSHKRLTNQLLIDWNVFIERAFPFKDKFRVLCIPCHKINTETQRIQRESTSVIKTISTKYGNLIVNSNWYNFLKNKQLSINGDYFVIRLHHLIYPENVSNLHVIDHINQNPKDNTVENLRAVPPHVNMLNKKKTATHRGNPTTSIYKGVGYHKQSGKWRMRVGNCSRPSFDALFVKEIDAAKCYDICSIYEYGEYAVLNFKREQYPKNITKKLIKQYFPKHKKSRFKGVTYKEKINKFAITINNKTEYYIDELEAAKRVDEEYFKSGQQFKCRMNLPEHYKELKEKYKDCISKRDGYKKQVQRSDGKIYNSLNELCQETNLSYSTLKRRINNKTMINGFTYTIFSHNFKK